MDENREQSPYHGFWVGIIALSVVPLAFYFIISGIILEHAKVGTSLFNEATSRLLGFALGSAFHAGCVLCGALTPSFNAVKKRIVDFFGNLIVSFPFAVKTYLSDMWHDGIVFDVYFAIMAGCVAVWVDALMEILEILERTML